MFVDGRMPQRKTNSAVGFIVIFNNFLKLDNPGKNEIMLFPLKISTDEGTKDTK